MAKINGMLVKIICDGVFVFLIDATAITERTTPAPKLATAEKHMSFIFLNEAKLFLPLGPVASGFS